MAVLEVKQAVEADGLRAAEIENLAYASNPFNSFLFPGPFPPNIRELRAAGMVKEAQNDHTVRWMKAIDPELGTIAFAKWVIHKETPDLKPVRFGPGCHIEACEAVFGWTQDERKRITGDQPYIRK